MNTPSLLDSRISQFKQNEIRPQSESPVRLRDLLEKNRHALICIDSPPALLKKYLQPPPPELQVTDFERCAAMRNSNQSWEESKVVECLLAAWESLCAEKSAPFVMIFLPRLATQHGRKFLGQLRAAKSQWDRNGHAPFSMILLADYPTHQQMCLENPEHPTDSPLAKELDDNTWYLESLAPLDPAIKWLTGGEAVSVDFFLQELGQKPYHDAGEWREAIRQLTHQWVDKLAQETDPAGWSNALRHALLLSTREKINQFGGHDRKVFEHHLAELIAVQPGRYAADDPEARENWYKMQHHARWRTFAELNARQQALLLSGFLRYEAEEENTSLRLRNPLLAWALCGYLKQNRSEASPRSKSVRDASSTPKTSWFGKNSYLSGLDYYLDFLLCKARYNEENVDGEADHWSVPKWPEPDTLSPAGIKGEWWKRLPAPKA
jgi:hypothetical protein